MLYDPKWQPPETTTEEWRDIVSKAADLIEKNGWCRCALKEERKTFFGLGPVKTSYCIVGALQEVAPGEYYEALHKMDCVLGHTACWNDKHGRTKQQVVSTLRAISKGVTVVV